MTPPRALLEAAIAILVCTSGCALLTKSDPLTPRYFSPEPTAASTSDGITRVPTTSPAMASLPELRLGKVTAASYLGERLVYRSSTYELGFYEDRRWTERPDAYFRRSLSRALFEKGGIRRIISGAGPTLDVELVEVAEMTAPAHVARVQATYVLYDPRAVRTEETVTVELPIRAVAADAQASEAVRALSESLAGVVSQIVGRVQSNLEAATAGADVTRARTADAVVR